MVEERGQLRTRRSVAAQRPHDSAALAGPAAYPVVYPWCRICLCRSSLSAALTCLQTATAHRATMTMLARRDTTGTPCSRSHSGAASWPCVITERSIGLTRRHPPRLVLAGTQTRLPTLLASGWCLAWKGGLSVLCARVCGDLSQRVCRQHTRTRTRTRRNATEISETSTARRSKRMNDWLRCARPSANKAASA